MKLATLSCLVVILAGCVAAPPLGAGSTREIDVEQLTLDATQLDDALRYLGPPLRNTVARDGSTTITYSLADPWNAGDILILFFTPEHVLRGKAIIADSDDDRADT